MRLSTFASDDGPKVGIALSAGDDLVDFQASLVRRGASPHLLDAATSVLRVIEGGPAVLDAAREILEAGQDAIVTAPSSSQLLAPLAEPRTLYCVGINYAPHSAEFQGSAAALPEAPVIFSKHLAITGPGDEIELHDEMTAQVDYEAELAVVIGKPGRDIPRDQAAEWVFGYTCLNDVTARDLQRRHQQWLIGKSLDTFCPMGPVIIERTDVPWPPALAIECLVNGEVRQHDTTASMIFGVPELIECISTGRTVHPGDVIATGTPAGVGMGMTPPTFLRKGDVVTVRIEAIGDLVNPCR